MVKWIKIIQTWPFWVTQIVQMMPGIPTPNSLIKNGEILMKNWEKLPKNSQNAPKMAKSGPKMAENGKNGHFWEKWENCQKMAKNGEKMV